MKTAGRPRPRLHATMRLDDYRSYYWWKDELIRFARRLGLSTQGNKQQLSVRIERRLLGKPTRPEPSTSQVKGPRDSERPLRRDTPVRNYKSDDKTREFFKAQIGPSFHFTCYLNQYRIAHPGLTYGDLVDEWVAERERRRGGLKRPIVGYAKYNNYIREFFADASNKGKTLREAAASWNSVKKKAGDQRYRPAQTSARRKLRKRT